MDPLVHYRVADAVATITLDSPTNRNALSAAVRTQLLSALDDAAVDDRARVVVLSHTGPAFCAGMDLKETATASAGSQGVRELPAILQRIARCPKPVVARVGGPARAGGVGIAAAADIVVASATATFAFSEVRIGLVPAVISVPVLNRVSGVAARELMLTGEVFDAARAMQIGLVNAVARGTGTAAAGSPDQVADPRAVAAALDEAVAGYVAALLKGGPSALSATKSLLRQGLDDSDERYAALLEMSAAQFASGEGREGATAFAEKRPPSWQG